MDVDEAIRLLWPDLDGIPDGARRRLERNPGFRQAAEALAQMVNAERSVFRALVEDYRDRA
jgi:hypothetical protein